MPAPLQHRCWANAAQVVGLAAAPPETHFAASLLPLLPVGAGLLGVNVASLQQQGECSAGAWCDPVALCVTGGSAAAALQLPHDLLEELRGKGCGLRVVVSACRDGATPLADFTLPTDAASWPPEGRLPLALPTHASSLLVTLLAAAASSQLGSGAHGADVFLAQLPVLVLTAAAHAEVLRLWATAVQDELQAGAAANAAAAAVAFWGVWAPFVLDFSAVLAMRDEDDDPLRGLLRAGVVQFLQGMGCQACLDLLQPPPIGPLSDGVPSDANAYVAMMPGGRPRLRYD
jgi:hypothetical protein